MRQLTMDQQQQHVMYMKVEVSTITPPALLLFHTRNMNHVAVGDVATHNRQQKQMNNHDDK